MSAWLSIVLLTISSLPIPAWAYEPNIHQQLTFIAARQFNQCVVDHPEYERLSALDARFMANANVAQADANAFVRMFRWNYYNRHDQSNRSVMGVIDTRFHRRFDELSQVVHDGDRRKQLRNLGRIVNYIQDVTSPPHAVPVYTARWWRWSFSDRFNRFAVDTQRVEQLVETACAFVVLPPPDYATILVDAANDTLTSVQSQVFGFPTTWEAYWKLASSADQFGEYGPAGNQFGQRANFRCGDQRCLLLKNDPLYQDFATDRHVAAVIATMQALTLLQTRTVPIETESNKPGNVGANRASDE